MTPRQLRSAKRLIRRLLDENARYRQNLSGAHTAAQSHLAATNRDIRDLHALIIPQPPPEDPDDANLDS